MDNDRAEIVDGKAAAEAVRSIIPQPDQAKKFARLIRVPIRRAKEMLYGRCWTKETIKRSSDALGDDFDRALSSDANRINRIKIELDDLREAMHRLQKQMEEVSRNVEQAKAFKPYRPPRRRPPDSDSGGNSGNGSGGSNILQSRGEWYRESRARIRHQATLVEYLSKDERYHKLAAEARRHLHTLRVIHAGALPYIMGADGTQQDRQNQSRDHPIYRAARDLDRRAGPKPPSVDHAFVRQMETAGND